MRRLSLDTAARHLRAVLLLGCALSLPAAVSAAPGGAGPSKMAASADKMATNKAPSTSPTWNELSPAQQQALAPLAPEWDKFPAARKTKWLAIGNKYATMKPDEQQRIQERMREWIKLTPEQRRQARENYARAKKLNSEQKSAKWEEYKQLPDEQKKQLAAASPPKKRVATLPSPASQGKTSKTIPPIKSAPKPILEQSVTPQVVNQSAIQPVVAPQPSK